MSIITLVEQKLYMRMDADYDLEDSLIGDMLETAEQWCEGYTGLSFTVKDNITQAVTSKRTELTAPVISVSHVFDSSDNVVDFIYSNNILYTNGCFSIVTYKTGYANGKLPESIKSAIKMMTSTLYENRDAYTIGERSQSLLEMPMGVKDLLKPYTRVGGLFL